MKIFTHERKDGRGISYQFSLFNENFSVPPAVAKSWGLKSQSLINIRWDHRPESHPHLFAIEAGDDNEGKGVGIQLFKTIDGKCHEHWLQREGANAVLLANTLYDLLRERIIGKSYKWLPSRKYIF